MAIDRNCLGACREVKVDISGGLDEDSDRFDVVLWRTMMYDNCVDDSNNNQFFHVHEDAGFR